MKVIDVSARQGGAWITHAFRLFQKAPMTWIALFGQWAMLMFVLFLLGAVGQALIVLLQPAFFAAFVIAARDQEAGVNPVRVSLFAGFVANGRALVLVGSIMLFVQAGFALALDAFGLGQQAIEIRQTSDLTLARQAIFDNPLPVILALLITGVVTLLFWFAVPLLALNTMSAGVAIRWSFYAAIANLGALVVLVMLMMFSLVFAMLPMMLGLVVWMPLYAITHYTSYRSVFSTD